MQLQTPNARRAPKHDGERFTISQLCKRFDLTLRTLRFYEHKGLISPERRVNRRLYRREDAEKVATILALKRFGFSIGEIKKLLDTSVPRAGRYPISVTQCDEQLGILRARLKETSDAIEELTSIRAAL
jgi:DNA-binding transcriptional MerR regulator